MVKKKMAVALVAVGVLTFAASFSAGFADVGTVEDTPAS